MSHRTVVVDMATTGLDPFAHVPVEIAWLRDGQNEPIVFIPPHRDDDIQRGSEEALAIIDYYGQSAGRRLDDRSKWDVGGTKLCELHHALKGQSFVSWNCFSDAIMLNVQFTRFGLSTSPWFRVVDLACYAAACIGRSPNDVPKLAEVCKLLRIEQRDFTAKGDAIATGKCLELLRPRRRGNDESSLLCFLKCRREVSSR